MERNSAKSISEYIEELKIARFVCSFCGNEEELSVENFKSSSKEAAAKILIEEGWRELTIDSVDGLACRPCVMDTQPRREG